MAAARGPPMKDPVYAVGDLRGNQPEFERARSLIPGKVAGYGIPL